MACVRCALVLALTVGTPWAQTGEDSPPPSTAPTPVQLTPPPAGAPSAVAPKVVFTPEAKAQLSAADKARAEALKQEGNDRYKAGRYKEAIEKFQMAFDINEDGNLLYSIGISYQQLEAWQECVNQLERYLETAPVGAKRDRAENSRKSCDARIETDQQLIISSVPAGARIYVDDKSKGVQGQTPFRTDVRPGNHTIWLEKSGFEPVKREIQVQKREPFRLDVPLEPIKNQGWIFVDCSVIDARIFIDGKTEGLTPLHEPLSHKAGAHQIVVERDGYTRFAQHVMVKKGQVTTVDAYMTRTEHLNTWRTPIGWTMNVFGILAIGGGITAYLFADVIDGGKFNDTQEFEDLALYEKVGYGVGGGLLAIGTSFVIWDKVRDVIDDEDRNPRYGEPVKLPSKNAQAPIIRVSPNGFSFGFAF